ncbi:hypothetical protein HUJ04_011500 [Dendroctonus ponderosae]|nr:hypothetical protein HUJ04_011500 [Dendroctonus ponderosae]
MDATHGTNPYDFKLITILVLDDFGEGFPVAFLFSNSEDFTVLQLFINAVKNVAGTVRAATFMSEDAELYFIAWSAVMDVTKTKKLLCIWHVDRAWRAKLNLIKEKSKQVECKWHLWAYLCLVIYFGYLLCFHSSVNKMGCLTGVSLSGEGLSSDLLVRSFWGCRIEVLRSSLVWSNKGFRIVWQCLPNCGEVIGVVVVFVSLLVRSSAFVTCISPSKHVRKCYKYGNMFTTEALGYLAPPAYRFPILAYNPGLSFIVRRWFRDVFFQKGAKQTVSVKQLAKRGCMCKDYVVTCKDGWTLSNNSIFTFFSMILNFFTEGLMIEREKFMFGPNHNAIRRLCPPKPFMKCKFNKN